MSETEEKNANMPGMRHLQQIGLSVLIGLCLLNSVSVADLSAQISTNNPYRASTGWENLPEGRNL